MAQTLPVPRARQPYGMPQHPTDPLVLQASPRQIRFLHPGYPDEHAILLVLPALDIPNGVHLGLALHSCAILADNRWDGYFTLDREGLQRVPTDDMDSTLDADAYYFNVPGDNEYPVVPTFAEWRFPHHSIPACWHRDPTFHASSARRCRLSYAASLLEDAHIVPRNQADEKWFNENGMAVYGPIHGGTNTIKFKVDIHQHFDRKPKFAIVPKYNKMVAHIFTSQSIEAREAIELYHNVPVLIDEQNSQLLLARLGWTVFQLFEPFLRKGVKRRLLRKTEHGHVVREEDAESCTQAWLSARPRSGSPSKRIRSDTAGAQDLYDSDVDISSDEQGQRRGRKRRRSSSLYNPQDSQSTDQDRPHSGSEISCSTDAKLLDHLKT